MAVWWVALFGAGMALVVATKIAFIGWGIGIPSIDFAGISGHAMRAAAVLPVIAYLALQGGRRSVKIIGVSAGVGLGILIAVSRVLVDAHSLSEAVSGFLLGTLIGVIFIRLARPLYKPSVNGWLVLVTLVSLFWVSSGEPAPTQQMLTEMALALSGHDRPFTRADWIATGQLLPKPVTLIR